MSNITTGVKQSLKRNVDTRIVVSSAIGAALLGVVTFVAIKSGIKPLKTVAKVAKNGAK